MSRLLSTLVVAVALATSSTAFAQHGFHIQPVPGLGHQNGHWNHHAHTPDLIQLDHLSDRLANIAGHLHEDAHQLSQDYHHSRTIECLVDQLHQLQQHMHLVLHQSARSAFQRSSVIGHMRSDVRQTDILLKRLHGELQHQSVDGTRPSDLCLIAHMRQIIVGNAFPLVRLMESELFGFNRVMNHPHVSQQHSFGIPQSVRSRSLSWRNFRIQF